MSQQDIFWFLVSCASSIDQIIDLECADKIALFNKEAEKYSLHISLIHNPAGPVNPNGRTHNKE